MAPGDLNLKKSWHPGLMKNQQKVWEKEQEALAERKKIQERQEEIKKERELADLRALQTSKSGKKVSDRVDWMYDTSGVSDGGKLAATDSEEYLLGKKRVDSLITQQKPEVAKIGLDKLQSQAQISDKEEFRRSQEDPLFKIKQQQIKRLHEVRQQRQPEANKHRIHRSGDDAEKRYRRDRERSDHHNWSSHDHSGVHRSHHRDSTRERHHKSSHRDSSRDSHYSSYKRDYSDIRGHTSTTSHEPNDSYRDREPLKRY